MGALLVADQAIMPDADVPNQGWEPFRTSEGWSRAYIFMRLRRQVNPSLAAIHSIQLSAVRISGTTTKTAKELARRRMVIRVAGFA
jgi:hypothetical protein